MLDKSQILFQEIFIAGHRPLEVRIDGVTCERAGLALPA